MKRILVVEDDTKIAAALAIRLEAAGYSVLSATDGLAGLKVAVEQKPDLVLMDIWMPVGLGFSVAQRMQSLGLKGIPIIFITASRAKGLKKAAEALGAAAFFEKPYDPQTLLAAVAKALKLHDSAPSENCPAAALA